MGRVGLQAVALKAAWTRPGSGQAGRSPLRARPGWAASVTHSEGAATQESGRQGPPRIGGTRGGGEPGLGYLARGRPGPHLGLPSR